MGKGTLPTYLLVLMFVTTTAFCQDAAKTGTPKEAMKVESISLVLMPTTLKNSKSGIDEPAVALSVENHTDIEIPFPQVQIFTELEDLEAPTTLLQRQATHRLKPGEPEVREGGYEPGISPGKTFTRKYRLSDFYQVTTPGIYTVRMRAAEEAMFKGGKWTVADRLNWLSSNTVEIPIK
jgi:hypothetical protein